MEEQRSSDADVRTWIIEVDADAAPYVDFHVARTWQGSFQAAWDAVVGHVLVDDPENGSFEFLTRTFLHFLSAEDLASIPAVALDTLDTQSLLDATFANLSTI